MILMGRNSLARKEICTRAASSNTIITIYFDIGHPVVYILTSNILNYSSNTTHVYLHRMLKFGY